MKFCIFFAFLCCLSIFSIAENNFIEKTTGYGYTQTQATNNALTLALEKILGENFFGNALFKEIAVSKQLGIILQYKILAQELESENHLWCVQVETEIDKTAKQKWEKISQSLAQKGLPKIMVCVEESLDGKSLENPVGEYQLTQKLEEMGFPLLERAWFKKTRTLEEKKLDKQEQYQYLIQIGQECKADFILVAKSQGNFVPSSADSCYIRHDYHFSIAIFHKGHIMGTINWKFSNRLDNLQYSKEKAGLAGFTEIINPECAQPLFVQIIKIWMEPA